MFEATWGEAPAADAADLADWTALGVLRERVHAALEPERAAKRLAQSQEAAVRLGVGDDAARGLLARYGASLASYLVVSAVTFDGPAPPAGESWGVAITKSPHPKCERCWNHRPTVGAAPAHPTLCDRCVEALPPGFARPAPVAS